MKFFHAPLKRSLLVFAMAFGALGFGSSMAFGQNGGLRKDAEYWIKVVATNKNLHENGRFDKLVSTRWQPRDKYTIFRLTRQSDGSYRVKVKADGRFWHANDRADKLVSTRFQPNDNYTRFIFERQSDGTYRIKVKASGRYLRCNPRDQVLSTRGQQKDNYARFKLTLVTY